jgi:hypothetical protein
MAYLGCILFGLMFMVMTAQSNGTLAQRMEQTFSWIHGWAPFSYIIILLVLVSPVVMLKIINSWPKREEPVNPMSKYRNAHDVVEDDA